MKKILILLSLVILSILSLTSNTFACSCIEPKYPLEAVDDANTVFIGKVTSIDTISETIGNFPNRFEVSTNKVNFQVDFVVKGEETKSIEITTREDSAACGFNFEEGKDYIVYSNLNENNELNVSLCSRTNLLANATEDLAVLNIKGTINAPRNDVELNTSTTNIDIIATNSEIEKIDTDKITNIKSEKNAYIGVTVGIFALVLIVLCVVGMNKKN